MKAEIKRALREELKRLRASYDAKIAELKEEIKALREMNKKLDKKAHKDTIEANKNLIEILREEIKELQEEKKMSVVRTKNIFATINDLNEYYKNNS